VELLSGNTVGLIIPDPTPARGQRISGKTTRMFAFYFSVVAKLFFFTHLLLDFDLNFFHISRFCQYVGKRRFVQLMLQFCNKTFSTINNHDTFKQVTNYFKESFCDSRNYSTRMKYKIFRVISATCNFLVLQ